MERKTKVTSVDYNVELGLKDMLIYSRRSESIQIHATNTET